MIPKVIYFYWGANKLSWLRYLSVLSFSKLNPSWQIKVYYTEHPVFDQHWNTGELSVQYKGKDWFPELNKIPNVELSVWDMDKHGFSNEAAEVHKADAFRLWALSEHGGISSDFDVLYYKPVPEDLLNYDIILSFNRELRYYSIGFIGGKSNQDMYKELLERGRSFQMTHYQSMGPRLWNTILPRENWWRHKNIWNMPMSFVYPHDSNHVSEIYEKGTLEKDGIGIHWYGGHRISGEWANKLTPKNYKQFDNRICNLLKEVI